MTSELEGKTHRNRLSLLKTTRLKYISWVETGAEEGSKDASNEYRKVGATN